MGGSAPHNFSKRQGYGVPHSRLGSACVPREKDSLPRQRVIVTSCRLTSSQTSAYYCLLYRFFPASDNSATAVLPCRPASKVRRVRLHGWGACEANADERFTNADGPPGTGIWNRRTARTRAQGKRSRNHTFAAAPWIFRLREGPSSPASRREEWNSGTISCNLRRSTSSGSARQPFELRRWLRRTSAKRVGAMVRRPELRMRGGQGLFVVEIQFFVELLAAADAA